MSRKLPVYFYLDVADEGLLLHKRLQINVGKDTIVTWCYPLGKRVAYTYSRVKKDYKPAFRTVEVAEMINRKWQTIDKAIARGDIDPPQYSYSLTPNRIKNKYLWSEQDILRAHEYFSNVHVGRPRKDGMITSYNLPTRRELLAMIRQETVLYVKNKDGDFVPTWKAHEF